MEFALAGEAAADDLIDTLSAVSVDAHDFRCTTRRHFQSEVADQLVELAVRQFTVFN
jgi:hypothetical protein